MTFLKARVSSALGTVKTCFRKAATQNSCRGLPGRLARGSPYLRPSTRSAYEIHIRRDLAPYLGAILLTELTLREV